MSAYPWIEDPVGIRGSCLDDGVSLVQVSQVVVSD